MTSNLMRLNFMPERDRGFGGLEVVIAVVLLGMAFALALKGTALVENVRAFLTAYQIQNYQVRIQSYQAEHHYFPGDDPSAPRRFKRENAVFNVRGVMVSSAGDGKIDGRLSDAVNANGENFMAWNDLRHAGLEGDPTLPGASAMPENPFGGVYGFDEGNLGQSGGSLCATRIPGRAAEMIDKSLDDGLIDKGRVVATSQYDVPGTFNHFDAPDSEPYDIEKEYIICAPILP